MNAFLSAAWRALAKRKKHLLEDIKALQAANMDIRNLSVLPVLWTRNLIGTYHLRYNEWNALGQFVEFDKARINFTAMGANVDGSYLEKRMVREVFLPMKAALGRKAASASSFEEALQALYMELRKEPQFRVMREVIESVDDALVFWMQQEHPRLEDVYLSFVWAGLTVTIDFPATEEAETETETEEETQEGPSWDGFRLSPDRSDPDSDADILGVLYSTDEDKT